MAAGSSPCHFTPPVFGGGEKIFTTRVGEAFRPSLAGSAPTISAVVGWSDGAILGLEIAIRHRARLSKLFAFAANSDPSGVKDVEKSPVFTAFIARAEKEYEALSATPGQYKSFVEQISRMWATQPHYTAADLKGITTPTWIVDADHDEAIKRENTEFMAAEIPGAGLLIQPEVSHFSFLQDPAQFTWDVMHFLARH